MRLPVLGALGALGLLTFAVPVLGDDKPLLLEKKGEVVLEGERSTGGVAFDATTGLLYVSHAANVDVIDVAKAERVGQLEGVEKARGIVVLPEAKRGFVCSAAKDRLVAFDLATLAVLKEIPVGDGGDAVLYVATVKELWVLGTKGNAITCIDPTSYEVKTTIRLEATPLHAVEHAAKNAVYVDLVNPDSVGVVDPRSHKVVGTHGVAPGSDPLMLALEPKSGVLFVACGNLQLVALETSGWKAAGSWNLGTAPGGAVCDAGNVYVPCEERARVVHVNSPKSISLVPAIDTEGARACTLDPATHRLFVVCGPKKGEEGTVKVVIFGPK